MRFKRSLSLPFAVSAIIFMACEISCWRNQPLTLKADAVRLMAECNKQHRYEDGIKVGLGWLKGHPDDADIHATIAMFYLEEAQTDSTHSRVLIDEAVRFADEAVDLGPDSINVLSTAGSAYEHSGDLSQNGRCDFYQKALNVVEHEKILEDAEFKKAPEGPHINWDQIRSMDEATHARLIQKIAGGGCK